MIDPSVIEVKQVMAAFLGAALALIGQGLVARGRRAVTGRALCIALLEEFNAARVDVYERPHGDSSEFAFALSRVSTQTFDTLFREMVLSLPASLTRDLMRYHLALKAIVASHGRDHFGAQKDFDAELSGLYGSLLARLESYGGQWRLRLMLWSGE